MMGKGQGRTTAEVTTMILDFVWSAFWAGVFGCIAWVCLTVWLG